MGTKNDPAAASSGQEFVISRVFDAPRDVVFDAWTRSEPLAQWWGPKGFKIRVSKLDFRPGGVFHYRMQAPDGLEMWGKFVYREIAPPERIVWVNSFSDEAGNLTRHPLSPGWPLEMLTTVTFVEREGKTTVTVNWVPLNASEPERKTFADGHGSMQKGWTGTLDQLTDYLAKS